MEIKKYRNMFLKKIVELRMRPAYSAKVTAIMVDMNWEEKEEWCAFLCELIKDCKSADEAVNIFIENKLIDEKIMNLKGDCDGTIS